MSSSKREREAARKKHEKWLARQAAAAAKRRRNRTIAAAVIGFAVLALVVALVVRLNSTPSPVATPVATPTAQASPTPTSTVPVPDPALAEGRTWTAVLKTSVGDITMELDGAAAPQAVSVFLSLAQEGFYTGNYCHRLTTQGIFVLQCGDPTAAPGNPANGTGGPEYRWGPVENAPADDMYPAGTVAFARVGGDANSQGSQFFLVYQDSQIPSDIAGGYSVIGRITSGLDIVAQVAQAGTQADGVSPATDVVINEVELP